MYMEYLLSKYIFCMVQFKLNLVNNIFFKYSNSINVKLLVAILTPLFVQVPSSLIQIVKVNGVINLSTLSGIIFFPFL
jgi:hypothetical protein